MSKTIVRPTLSLGNHIYLYRLLRDAIGCGKQTFMTQVEEALAAGDMTAYDLGFESTRELLEELAKVRGEVRVEPHRQQASFFDKLRDTFMG